VTSVRGTVEYRIGQIQKQQATIARRGQGGDWFELKVAPTCPPSKRLYIRGGKEFNTFRVADYNYRAYTIPDLIANLEDIDEVQVDVSFTNAYWYKCYALLLKLPEEPIEPTISDWKFHLWGDEEELETAAEAEAHMEIPILVDSHPWYYSGTLYGYPLCGVILRNNGTVGAGCPIMPVDFLNRGRSYMWPTDIRPKRFWAMT